MELLKFDLDLMRENIDNQTSRHFNSVRNAQPNIGTAICVPRIFSTQQQQTISEWFYASQSHRDSKQLGINTEKRPKSEERKR